MENTNTFNSRTELLFWHFFRATIWAASGVAAARWLPRRLSLEERIRHATLSITARHFCMSARKLEERSLIAVIAVRARLCWTFWY
jgi:hypothetical protein